MGNSGEQKRRPSLNDPVDAFSVAKEVHPGVTTLQRPRKSGFMDAL
jgi:hypothetical protein